MMPILDWTGHKFSTITVIGFSHREHKHGTYFNCVCECGNNLLIKSETIRRSPLSICPCSKPDYNKMIGRVYGRLTVMSFKPIGKQNRTHFLCRCECGKEKYISLGNIQTTRSCGCLAVEKTKLVNTKHKLTHTKEYHTWGGIIGRCYNKNNKDYFRYGGIGISVSDEWRNDFLVFLNDMGVAPTPQHSIDRMDNNKGYCRENCRWATSKEQANNKRKTHKILYKDNLYTIRDLSTILNTNYDALYAKLKRQSFKI